MTNPKLERTPTMKNFVSRFLDVVDAFPMLSLAIITACAATTFAVLVLA